MTPRGVNMPKKSTPNTMGLMMVCSNKPNLVHTQFSGASVLGANKAKQRNKILSPASSRSCAWAASSGFDDKKGHGPKKAGFIENGSFEK
jgi:hypothetical protein